MSRQDRTSKAKGAPIPGKSQAKTTVATATPALLQRAQMTPSSLSPNDVKHLQRTIGNRATVGLLSRALPIQTKLTLGPAVDKYEQEADQVAAQVVRQIDREPVQRQEDEEIQMKSFASLQRQEEDEALQMKPLAASVHRLQRTPVEPIRRAFVLQRADIEEEEMVQGKYEHGPEGGEVEPSVTRQIQAARGGGRPLDEGVRSSMESGFGADFSNVRVHTGTQADTLNRSLNARAFTVGRDIFFKGGEYNAGSSGGKKLLAHELTHTVQQGAAGVQRDTVQRMAFENTNWNSATSARISSGGGGGVFILNDGGKEPIVVKANETFAEEGRLFSELFQNTFVDTNMDQAGGRKGKEWTMSAPGTRIAQGPEMQLIRDTIDRLLPDSENDPRIARGKAAIVDPQVPTTIYSYASGEDFSKFLYPAKRNEQQPKSAKQRLKAVSELWKGPGLLTLLGRATALDIFTGNSDRMIEFNAENFMVEIGKKKKTVTLIDNIYDAHLAGGTFAGKDAFDQWTAKRILSDAIEEGIMIPVEALRAGQYTELAQTVLAFFTSNLAFNEQSLFKGISAEMKVGIQKQLPQMIEWFSTGLQAGFRALLQAVAAVEQRMIDQPLQGRDAEILTNLIARKQYLLGMDANLAWQTAVRQVNEILNPQQAWQAPQMDRGNNRAGVRIGGRRRQPPQVPNRANRPVLNHN